MCICHATGFPLLQFLFEVESGIELLEGCLSDILLSLDDVYMSLCGGLNEELLTEFLLFPV